MSKSRFLLKSKTAKEALEKQGNKTSKYKSFKFTSDMAQLLILPKIDWEGKGNDPFGDVPIFESVSHEMWKQKKIVASCASPEFEGEEDRMAQIGWDIRERFLDDNNEKKKEFFKEWLPNKTQYVNVLDLDDIDAGPQVYRLSGSVREEIEDFIKDLKDEFADADEIDFTSLCDFDEGTVLQVKTNGKDGIARRYKAKFLNETADLLKDGIVEEDELDGIADKMYDLTKLQPRFDQDAFDNYLERLMKKAEKLGIEVDGDGDDDSDSDSDSDEFEESDSKDDSLEEDDDFNEDDIDFEEDDKLEEDTEEEVEEKPARTKSSRPAKKESEPAKKEGRLRSRTKSSDKKEDTKEKTTRSRTRSRKK